MLAVALVIFMLVALLGLALYGTTAAASADTNVVTIAAEFTSTVPTAHSDSTATEKYYNQLASGTGAYPLAADDKFEVAYTITNTAAYTGATLDLTNTGFTIYDVKIGDTSIKTSGTTTITVSGQTVTFKLSGASAGYAKLMYYGNIAASSTITVKVTYNLTAAPATYTNLKLNIENSRADISMIKSESIKSNDVTIYARSTASIMNANPAKTYDSTAVANVPTFEPAVSDEGYTSRRETPVVTWSADGESYSDVAPINAGTYYTKSTTAANTYYEATVDVDTFTIAQKAVTLTAENKTTEHGDALATLTWTGDSGFYAADGVTVSASTTAATTGTNSNVGTYPITLATAATPTSGYAGLANYAITYEHAQTSGDYGVYTITRKFIAVPTVTIFNNSATTGTTIAVAGSEDVNYNGFVYSFDYAAASDNAYSGVASPAASKDVGTYVLTLTIGSNYRWGATVDAAEDLADKVFTYVVKKVDLHVSLDHAAITYRDAVPTTGYSISLPTAAVGGETVDSISLTQANFNTAYVQGNPVGTYAITLTEESDTDTAIKAHFSNYNVIYDTANKLSVGKLTVTATNSWVAYKSGDSATMTYDAAAHGIEAVATGYTFGGVEICNVALSDGDNSNGTQTHVSGDEAAVTLTATFTLKGDSAKDDYNNVITDNYTLAEGVQTKNITITRKAITVTANPKTITYGDAFANDGVTYGEFAGSETSAVLTGTLAYATDYVAEALNEKRVVGTYYIRPSGLSNNDYAINFVDGTLTVEKKVVTFTWSETKSWVYDAASHTITATVVGAEYGETITVDEYSGNASAINVGNYSRTVTSLNDDDNYAITTESSKTEAYSITKAPITITITPASSLVYTSADKTVFTVTVSGMIGSETLTYTFDGTNLNEADGTFALSNASETFTGMLAQSYGLELTAVANGTGLVGNYDYTLPDAAENTIAKATFTPGAISYSGATVSWAAVTGTQGSDVITFTYTVNKGATEKQSSTSLMSYTASATGSDYVLAISFAGDRAANYNAIANQALLEVFSVTFTDTASEHTSEPTVFADVVYYAFSGQTVAAHSAWSLQNYSWEGWKYTPSSEEITYDAPALSASLTVRATWQIKTVAVTYYYKLSGAAEWETYKAAVVTNAYAALETVPTITWFKNVGWNDAATMDGATKTTLDYETYAATRSFYTVYTFAVGAGDVNGDKAITTADATLMAEKWVGGYDISSNLLTSIAAAWDVADQFDEGVYTFAYAPATAPYYLVMVEDVNADGALSAADAAAAAVATVASNYLGVTTEEVNDGYYGIVIILPAALVSEDQVITGISAAPASVTVDGAAVVADYSAGILTLPTALTSGQTVEIIMANGAKFKYTKA